MACHPLLPYNSWLSLPVILGAHTFLCFLKLIICTMLACFLPPLNPSFQNLLSPRALPFPVFSLSHSYSSPWPWLEMLLLRDAWWPPGPKFLRFSDHGNPCSAYEKYIQSHVRAMTQTLWGHAWKAATLANSHVLPRKVETTPLDQLCLRFWLHIGQAHGINIPGACVTSLFFLTFDSHAAKVENCHLRPMFQTFVCRRIIMMS